jgi:hypothetical protein
MLEFFRVEHGDNEVADEQNGDDADEDGFHGIARLEGVAKQGVNHAEGKEAEGDCDEDEIGHDGGC